MMSHVHEHHSAVRGMAVCVHCRVLRVQHRVEVLTIADVCDCLIYSNILITDTDIVHDVV